MQYKTLLGLIISISLTRTISQARSYPIQTVTLNHCHIDNGSGEQSCTLPLPVIEKADYMKYINDPIYTRVYSTLRSATYTQGRDIGLGSHKGVDIATAIGTPVYAAYAGEVIEAGRRSNRGRVVTIQHQRNGKKLRTNYAHLSEIVVRIGDQVQEGQKIAESGDTGNSDGPHLHFQIDQNQDDRHPRHFINCSGDNHDIVNGGLCQDQIYPNTLDPILFLETQSKITQAQTNNKSYKDAFTISGFDGGYLPIQAYQSILLQNSNNSRYITANQPIRIIYDSSNLKIFPDTISFIGRERKIFITPLQKSINIITIQQGDTIIQKIPLIIGEQDTFNINDNDIKKLLRRYLF